MHCQEVEWQILSPLTYSFQYSHFVKFFGLEKLHRDLNDNEVFGFQGKENAGDNYGSFARGYIQIPEDGDYTFYISSDDAGELWISPDANPANVEMIAIQNGCCDPLFGANRLTERSGTLTGLTKGDFHYVEAYQVEGGGGAYLQVGWMKPDGTQEIIPARHLIQFYEDPGDGFSGFAPRSGQAAPQFNAFSNNGAQGALANVSTTEGLNAIMDVDVIGTMPMTFSWQVNGEPIENPLSYYMVDNVPISMDGSTVEVTISNSLGTVTALATLSVARDTVAPTLISARGSGFPEGIVVSFSEAVSESSATDPDHYSITGQDVNVSGVSMLTDRSVLLSVSEYNTDPMTLSVSGVQDIAASPNTIPAGSSTQIALTTTLLAYWDFNDTSNPAVTVDVSGGHAGQLNGAEFTSDTGGFTGAGGNSAMDFGSDSAGQHVIVEDASFLNASAAANQMTVSFWQRNNANPNSSSFWMVSPGSSGSARGFQAHVPWSNNNIYFDSAGCCNGATQRINAPINTFSEFYEGFFSDWHHYAFIKNGDTKEIWIDGVLFLSGTNTGPLPSDFTFMTIGSDQNGGNSVAGVIDDFSVFNVALTPEELAGLANQGTPSDLSMPLSAPLSIVSQPESQDLDELQTATFSVEAEGGSPSSIGYQWYRDGVPVMGANQASYSFGPLTLDDDGSTIMVKVFNIDGTFATVDSNEVTLNVASDVEAPRIVNTRGSFNRDSVTIEFNEAVEQTSAENISNYSIDGLTVTSAVLNASGTTVQLETNSQNSGETYTVVINGVSDISNNANATADATDTFIAWEMLSGGVLFEAFTGIGGTPVADLTNNAKFPNNPDEVRFLTGFDTPNGYGENYGARVRGWFVPKVSGEYTFFIRSDDASALWFNPNGEAEVSTLTGDIPVAQETGCCNPFQESGAAQTSNAFSLQAGNRYYMEGIVKEAGGGDYLQVAYRLSGDNTPAASLTPISGDELETLWDVDAEIQFTQQPQDQLAVLPSPGDEIAMFDLNNDDGGFSITTEGPVPGPWEYNAASGQWVADGSVAGDGGPYHSILTTPEITIPESGGVTLRFSHRYAFESGLFDAGQIRYSVNGSTFEPLPAGHIVQNGYSAGAIVGNGILNGQRGFNGTSAGYADGVHITTTAIISLLSAGDKVQIQFVGGWDEAATGMNPNWVIDSVGFFRLPPVQQDFSVNDGGFVVDTVGAVPFPWEYDPEDGVWFSGSEAGCGGPYWSFLNSPSYLVVEDGEVIVSFNHRYAFEGDLYDGGQVRISVNGDDYIQVSAEAFSENGYAENNIIGNGIILGQRAFNATSPGYADGNYITSTANFGSFSAGDSISVQFLGGWDECTTGTHPNWEITNLISDQLVLGSVPVASTFTAEANALQHGEILSANYQWQRDDGNGFVDIPGATGAEFAIFPEEADLDSTFRVRAWVPGVNLFSSTSKLVLEVTEQPMISLTTVDGVIVIEYSGTLEAADNVNGPYTAVAGATSPYMPAGDAAMMFYRSAQ